MELNKNIELLDEPVALNSVPTTNGSKRKRRCSQSLIETDQNPPSQKKAPCGEQKQSDIDDSHQLNNVDTAGTGVNVHNVDCNSFSLEHFCDEVLYEIIKYLDTWSLMTLMNVSLRFQKFVLDKRLWEDIDLSQAPLPLGILEDMLERSHEKTTSIKLRGPSPTQHLEGEIQHFNKTLRHSLTTRCTKLVTLELYGVTIDFNQVTFNDFPTSLKRLVLSNCHARVDANKSIFTGIDTILINLKELAIETNAWFDPYYVMPIAKLPILTYLSLKGCSQMQEFIPYGSIAGRHGFKQLEILDLRETPLNDSDLQCFNAVETLRELYLQCPAEDITSEETSSTNINSSTTSTKKETEVEECQPSTSSGTKSTRANESSASVNSSSDSSFSQENSSPTCSIPTAMSGYLQGLSSPSSSSSSESSKDSPQYSNLPRLPSRSDRSRPREPPLVDPHFVPSIGRNIPSRSRFLPRPDHIIYLDCRNRNTPNAVHISIRDNLREPRLLLQRHLGLPQNHPSPPAFEQMIRHNLFWDIINPLGRVSGAGGPDRVFDEENDLEYDGEAIQNPFSSRGRSRPVQRGSISDRGVCCFGRTREPVQHGVIWIRFNPRPTENRFERFSVRDYKSVTDTSLEHLVLCSPHLVYLDVSGTSVTMEGIRLFKDLKPECKVLAEHITSTVL